MLLIIDILSIVFTAIRPGKYSAAMHHVLVPLAFVLPPVAPFVATETLHIVCMELTLVLRASGPYYYA
jgi:hypothetical protein